jgi:hypothetical protein
MKLQALKTFSSGGGKLVKQGEIFDATEKHGEEYIRLKLAEEITSQAPRTINKDPQEIENKHYNEEELLELNVSGLKKIAKDIGVVGYSTMSKSELIFAIRAKQNTTNLEA